LRIPHNRWPRTRNLNAVRPQRFAFTETYWLKQDKTGTKIISNKKTRRTCVQAGFCSSSSALSLPADQRARLPPASAAKADPEADHWWWRGAKQG
jgi:hypothetical protein